MENKKRGIKVIDVFVLSLIAALGWTTVYYHDKACQLVALSPVPVNCNACKIKYDIAAVKPEGKPLKEYYARHDRGPDTALEIYQAMYKEKERFRLMAEAGLVQLAVTEQKYKDSIQNINAERAGLARINLNLIGEAEGLKNQIKNDKKYKQLADTMRTVQYQKSYVLNPEINQFLLQLRSSYSLNKPGFNLGGGIEYKTPREGFSAVLFYNPYTNKFQESLGVRYDLWRMRIKMHPDTIINNN